MLSNNQKNRDFAILCDLGWRLLKLRSLISPLPEILIHPKGRLDDLNHDHIWQVSPQPSCDDKYKCYIVQVIGVLIILKNWKNKATEKLGLVTPRSGEKRPWISTVQLTNS